MECIYPLCSGEREKHDIRVCHALNGFCLFCRRRGHHVWSHKFHDIITMEIIFRVWQGFGVLSSLPLLAQTDCARQPKKEEYRFGPYNRHANEEVYDKEYF